MQSTPFRVLHGIIVETSSNNSVSIFANNHVVSGSSSVSFADLRTTWNTTGNPTAFKLNVIDTASAGNSAIIDLQRNSSSVFKVDKSGFITATRFSTNNNGLVHNNNGSYLRLGNTYIYESSTVSNVLQQRNSTSPQIFEIYNTFTDGSNYERLSLIANSTAQYIQTEQAGTGASKSLHLGANNATHMVVAANGNIGIGTTTPATKLSVSGTTTLGGNVTISSTSSLTANGSAGTAGDVLLSSGSAVYWGQNNIDGGTPFSVF